MVELSADERELALGITLYVYCSDCGGIAGTAKYHPAGNDCAGQCKSTSLPYRALYPNLADRHRCFLIAQKCYQLLLSSQTTTRWTASITRRRESESFRWTSFNFPPRLVHHW